LRDTVDGSEIRRSPVDMVDIPSFTGFNAPSQVVSRISEPSTVSVYVEQIERSVFQSGSILPFRTFRTSRERRLVRTMVVPLNGPVTQTVVLPDLGGWIRVELASRLDARAKSKSMVNIPIGSMGLVQYIYLHLA